MALDLHIILKIKIKTQSYIILEIEIAPDNSYIVVTELNAKGTCENN